MEKQYPYLPIGMQDFEKVRRLGCYYVDKTGLIEDLLTHPAQVSLFTRPRRFGKSLNQSMLQHFFEIGVNPALFEGLHISENRAICEQYQGQYPVIMMQFSGVGGLNFAEAEQSMWGEIQREATRLNRKYNLAESTALDNEEKARLMALRRAEGDLGRSLEYLSQIVYDHCGKKVIVLLDEYDVPLQKAELGGYYDQMVGLVSRFFSNGLKTNPAIEFTVVTGCLRVAKESIFTGFNNVYVNTILDVTDGEWFGFTEDEVGAMLQTYQLTPYAEVTKQWYDGYRMGERSVYCPWDVILWVDHLERDREPEPQNFWANTSGNDILHRFASLADRQTRDDMETLIDGGTIVKPINMNLIYRDLNASIDNIWSVLLITGYLTFGKKDGADNYELRLPNGEVRDLFRTEYENWFKEKVLYRDGLLPKLLAAWNAGDAAGAERALQQILDIRVSLRDMQTVPARKEIYYQGFLNGLLANLGGNWFTRSQAERGDGYPDLVLENEAQAQVVILELKYAADGTPRALNRASAAAAAQICDRHYVRYYEELEYRTIHSYGIGFYARRCRMKEVE